MTQDPDATPPPTDDVPPEHTAQVEDPPEPDVAEPGTPGDVSTDDVPPEHTAQVEDPDRGEVPAPGQDTPGQESQDPIAAAERERDEYLDALRRKQAEFENFRKRMMREGAAQRITGHAEVAERMLDVLDDFDRTIEAAGEVEPGFLKGVELVHDKLARVLADFGLSRIDDTEVAFDPNRHEAVQQVAADESLDEPVVSQILRPGYELGGRTLRPAMVVVQQ